jgi:hypothetical protein
MKHPLAASFMRTSLPGEALERDRKPMMMRHLGDGHAVADRQRPEHIEIEIGVRLDQGAHVEIARVACQPRQNLKQQPEPNLVPPIEVVEAVKQSESDQLQYQFFVRRLLYEISENKNEVREDRYGLGPRSSLPSWQ